MTFETWIMYSVQKTVGVEHPVLKDKIRSMMMAPEIIIRQMYKTAIVTPLVDTTRMIDILPINVIAIMLIRTPSMMTTLNSTGAYYKIPIITFHLNNKPVTASERIVTNTNSLV